MRDKQVVYMAGCMDEKTDRAMTFIAKVELESRGFAVIDEYDLPRGKGLSQSERQRFGNAAIGVSDIVCFLPGWELVLAAVQERVRRRQPGKRAPHPRPGTARPGSRCRWRSCRHGDAAGVRLGQNLWHRSSQ